MAKPTPDMLGTGGAAKAAKKIKQQKNRRDDKLSEIVGKINRGRGKNK